MREIPAAVRRQALHPFSTLPVNANRRREVGLYTSTLLHPLPAAQFVEPLADLAPSDVDAAIAEARAVISAAGRNAGVWLTGPDHPWLADALAARGLRNEDSILEATETAMVLGDNSGQRVDGVRVTRVETFEEFAAGVRLTGLAFSMSAEEIAGTEAQLDDLWKDYLASDANQRWNAYLDGELVGTAGATSGDGGMNLFGGAVHPNGRGHGVYRALVQARWESAVEQGNPWLTVQAGRMSRPILERLGFSIVAEMPTYLDQF